MYIERVQKKHKGKTYTSVLLRQSVRIGKKVVSRTICSLTHLPPDLQQLIEQYLKEKKGIGGKEVDSSVLGIEERGTKEYGASGVLWALARELELDRMILSRKERWREDALALVVGRVVYQGSKLSLTEVGEDSVLWELAGHKVGEEVDVDRSGYEVMDRLLERKEAIEKELARRHLGRGRLVYYDVTSVYMEGEYEGNRLVQYGYSRDGKRGKKQILVGLLTNEEGCPVAVDVWEGNRSEGQTVEEMAERLAGKYGVEEVVFVGDRGMLRAPQREVLRKLGYGVVSALRHQEVRRLLEEKVGQLELFGEAFPIEVRGPEGSREWYVVYRNEFLAAEERTTREGMVKRAQEGLERISRWKRPRSAEQIGEAVGKVFAKWPVEKFFRWWVEDGRLRYEVKEEELKEAARWDGIYGIRTDVDRNRWGPEQVVKAYRGLGQVEQAFRQLKTVSLEIRPVYHRLEQRIRAHVFVCMLAYYLQWHLWRRLRPLWEEDGKGKNRRWSWPVVMEQLRSIRVVGLWREETFLGYKMIRPTPQQQRILDLAGVSLPPLQGRLART